MYYNKRKLHPAKNVKNIFKGGCLLCDVTSVCVWWSVVPMWCHKCMCVVEGTTYVMSQMYVCGGGCYLCDVIVLCVVASPVWCHHAFSALLRLPVLSCCVDYMCYWHVCSRESLFYEVTCVKVTGVTVSVMRVCVISDVTTFSLSVFHHVCPMYHFNLWSDVWSDFVLLWYLDIWLLW